MPLRRRGDDRFDSITRRRADGQRADQRRLHMDGDEPGCFCDGVPTIRTRRRQRARRRDPQCRHRTSSVATRGGDHDQRDASCAGANSRSGAHTRTNSDARADAGTHTQPRRRRRRPTPTPAPTPAPVPTPTPPPAPVPVPVKPIDVSGKATAVSGSCPNIVFQVKDRTVYTTILTTYKKTSCNNIDKGMDLDISGMEMSDQRVRADQVTKK